VAARQRLRQHPKEKEIATVDPVAPIERRAYVGLGANQGEVMSGLQSAINAVQSIERSRLVAVSPFYRSVPIDAPGPDYINAVLSLDTSLEPYSLLLHLADIELMLGRKRRANDVPHSAPRPIDLDLLLVGNLIVRSTPLVLPHPRMQQRAFVLRPLLDLAPDLVIPGYGPASQLLAQVSDQVVERLA
jgi:2-amino-4-hydroxy-6-hydroxymethyldihydropteridine diphosphokinase